MDEMENEFGAMPGNPDLDADEMEDEDGMMPKGDEEEEEEDDDLL